MDTTVTQKRLYTLGWFRALLVWLFLLCAFGSLMGRLYYIQVLHPDFLIQEGNERVQRSYVFEPARGLIYDRNGKLLAISMPVKQVFSDNKLLHEKGVVADEALMRKIAALLELPLEDLKARTNDPKRRHVRLKQYLDLKKAAELSRLKLAGLIISDNYQRYYPTGEANAQVVGLLNGEGRGVLGVERSFNAYLTPSEALRTVHQDSTGHIIENLKTEDGKAGGNLMLSIDDRLQSYAYAVLSEEREKRQAESATAVMINVKTGEIMVMVSVPSFDPNDPNGYNDSGARNRAVSDTYEPGSTIKPLIALSALEAGAVTWNEVIDTRPYIVNGKVIRDTHSMESGTLSDILKYSSNTGMAHIAQRMPPEQMVETLARFGFGQLSAARLTGEVRGQINVGRTFWAEIDKATMGYGYGFTVTALQMASAYATLANNGVRLPVTVLKAHAKAQGQAVASETEVRRVQNALENVVAEGSGRKAAIHRYRIAGKTGTAKIAGLSGYGNHYLANFAGFAPLSDPRFALVVAVRDPKGAYYGSQVAAPVFSSIMTRALQLYNVAPDRDETEVKVK